MGKGGFNLATYTEHYGLHQWESTDDFLRTDFNTDFQKIDTALGAKCQLVAGSYVGDGAEEREFDLGFTPAAVFTCNERGQTYKSPSYYGGLALPGVPVKGDSYATGEVELVAVIDGGFRVKHRDATGGGGYVNANVSGMGYTYLAFR